MLRKALLAFLGAALIAPALSLHTCNSGFDAYYQIDDGSFVGRDGEPVERADKLFLKVMERVAEDEGCTLEEAVKLEGCYNGPATSRTRRGEYGFGGKATWDCEGEERVRHIVVGVRPGRKGTWKQEYLFDEDASNWPEA